MATALQALPNIGSVSVTRKGPDGQLGFSWFVTFIENPGSFPAGSGDIALLSSDCSRLEGGGAWCAVEEVSAGTPELSGGFVLAFMGSGDGGGATRYTDELPYNSLPEEVGRSVPSEVFPKAKWPGLYVLAVSFGKVGIMDSRMLYNHKTADYKNSGPVKTRRSLVRYMINTTKYALPKPC